MYALDHDGALLPSPKKIKPTSTFPWAQADLQLDTVITDNISFGPNVRNFLKPQIGKKFSCHSDFMDWVKSNTGKTLADAIQAWHALENRKNDPAFKRSIAKHNMMSQYVRDFLKDNSDCSFKDAVMYWKLKKKLPTKDGFIVYESSDLNLT